MQVPEADGRMPLRSPTSCLCSWSAWFMSMVMVVLVVGVSQCVLL